MPLSSSNSSDLKEFQQTKGTQNIHLLSLYSYTLNTKGHEKSTLKVISGDSMEIMSIWMVLFSIQHLTV